MWECVLWIGRSRLALRCVGGVKTTGHVFLSMGLIWYPEKSMGSFPLTRSAGLDSLNQEWPRTESGPFLFLHTYRIMWCMTFMWVSREGLWAQGVFPPLAWQGLGSRECRDWSLPTPLETTRWQGQWEWSLALTPSPLIDGAKPAYRGKPGE